MSAIWIVAALCFVGDLWLAYYLWRERHAHTYTKAALRWWQRYGGVR